MRKTIAAVGVMALILVSGCGDGKSTSLPSPAAVSGKVTLASGAPVANVQIFFHPLDAAAPASGVVKADGSFALQTYDDKPGACPGKYRVIFRADTKGSAAVQKQSNAALASIPTKYKEDASPLEVEVPSGGKTDFVLKLDAK